MRPSRSFLIFCLVGICAIVLQKIFLHYGPDDSGAGKFTYNLVGEKFGFPTFVYVGSSSPPRVKLMWQVLGYKEDQDKKGGIYAVKFVHTTQDGPAITTVQGQLSCRYDAEQKAFTLLDLKILR